MSELTAPEGLVSLGSGKVRDLYEVDDGHLLLVASDRISAFDVVLDDPVPGKGEVLTALTAFGCAQQSGSSDEQRRGGFYSGVTGGWSRP